MAQMTLKHVKGNTYYIPSPANIGLYAVNGEAVLIDSGNDSDAGRQILRLLNNEGLKLKLIVNTHSNADHIGGNSFLQEKTGCKIAATKQEAAFIESPVLEPSFLYGGFPLKDTKNKFIMAKPSSVTDVISSSGEMPETGLKAVPLPGHFFDMIGVMTPDNIFFAADSLFPENIINKYHLFFLWDIRAYLDTIERLKTIDAELYIPSHGEPLSNVNVLAELNRKKIFEIAEKIQESCREPVTSEAVLEKVCTSYEISLNPNQYILLSSTVRSYLSYLLEEDLIECIFEGPRMVWKKKG